MYIKIKIDLNTIVKFFIFFILLADARFLYLIPLTSKYVRLIEGSSFIFSFALVTYFLMKRSLYEKALKNYRFLQLYLIYSIIVMILHWVYAVHTYSIPLFNAFTAGHSYFSLVMVPIYLYAFEENSNLLEKMMKTLAIIGAIGAIIVIFTGVCADNGLPVLFKLVSYGQRDGHARIAYEPASLFSILYFGDRFLSESKRKKIYGFYFLISLIGLVYYVNTRIMIISYGCAIGAMVLISNIGIKKKALIVGIAIVVAGFVAVNAGNVFDTFSVESDKGSSTLARLVAIEHFTGYFMSNPIFAIGLAAPVRDDLEVVLHGPTGIAALEDLGILGGVFRLGIIGVFIFILPLARMLYISWRMYLDKNRYSILFVGIIVNLIVSQVSLNYLDVGRSVLISFYWAAMEYVYLGERKNGFI